MTVGPFSTMDNARRGGAECVEFDCGLRRLPVGRNAKLTEAGETV